MTNFEETTTDDFIETLSLAEKAYLCLLVIRSALITPDMEKEMLIDGIDAVLYEALESGALNKHIKAGYINEHLLTIN